MLVEFVSVDGTSYSPVAQIVGAKGWVQGCGVAVSWSIAMAGWGPGCDDEVRTQRSLITGEMMAQPGLMEKGTNADLKREMISVAVKRFKELKIWDRPGQLFPQPDH